MWKGRSYESKDVELQANDAEASSAAVCAWIDARNATIEIIFGVP